MSRRGFGSRAQRGSGVRVATASEPVRCEGAARSSHRLRWSRRWAVFLVAGLAVAAGSAIAVDRAFLAGQQTRSEFMQSVLDGAVSGPNRLAPGATAYVSGPHGTWVGSAGVADVRNGARMRADARMRIESNSKTWLVAAFLQLVQEGKLSLDDTVDRWLPGLLRAHGSEITIRQLMSDSSGLIDDNDVFVPGAGRAYLARVGDPRLRAQLRAVAARIQANPAVEVSPLWFIRLAAWQPLVALPGTAYHHSNIGWNVAGLIAAKASGEPLPLLYRERIFQPLRLRRTAYDPQGPIGGAHANGYALAAKGTITDTTAWHLGKGADGAIVTDAKDEARFLTGFTSGKLLDPAFLGELGTGDPSGCGGPSVHSGSGAGDGFKSDVVCAIDGSRVAVLLLNGVRAGHTGFARSAAAAGSLYCAG
jgi:D-alanyl-D-alanine carboxypeptidase